MRKSTRSAKLAVIIAGTMATSAATLLVTSVTSAATSAAGKTPVERMDTFLRQQFPGKIADSDTLMENSHYGAATVSLALALSTYKFDRAATTALNKEIEAVTALNKRGARLKTEIDLAEQTHGTLDYKSKQLASYASDPVRVKNSITDHLEQKYAVMSSRATSARNQFNSLSGALNSIETHLNKTPEGLTLLSSIKSQFQPEFDELDSVIAKYTAAQNALDAELSELAKSPGLPESYIGNNGEKIIATVREADAAEQKVKVLKVEQEAIAARSEALAVRVAKHTGVVNRVKVAGVKVIGYVGTIAILSNSAGALYIAKTLGRDPGLVPFYDVAMNTTPDDYKRAVELLLAQ